MQRVAGSDKKNTLLKMRVWLYLEWKCQAVKQRKWICKNADFILIETQRTIETNQEVLEFLIDFPHL